MPERSIIEIPAIPVSRVDDNNGRPIKVAAYCRVSTSSEEQLSSYNSQIEYYTTLIMENPNWQFAGVFADEGITGTNTKNREQFKKMIRKCEQGKIDLVLTKSVSRFARNTLDCIKYVRKLKEFGVGVVFEKEGINTLEDDDETLFTISGALAQAESVSHSKNVRMGYRQNFKAGKIPFHNIFGYRRGEDDNLAIMPEEAEVVRRIFERYLAGQSVGKIRKDLEVDGILSPRGKATWSEGMLQHMLRNEKYSGDALLQKTHVEDVLTGRSKRNNGQLPQYFIQNNHPAIVSRDIFNKVQVEIARRASKQKTPSPTARTQTSKYSGKFALNEILVCGECGANYRRATWTRPNRSRQVVWRCISRLEHGKKYCKRSVTIDEQQLHETIRSTINQVIFKELLLEAVLDSANETGMPELIGELTAIYMSGPPELKEYDDGYARLLIGMIKVQENTLRLVFKDGTEVVRGIG